MHDSPVVFQVLLSEWDDLQRIHATNPATIQRKANREIEIAETLKRDGYAVTLNNGFSLQEIIDTRQRAMRYMNDRLQN